MPETNVQPNRRRFIQMTGKLSAGAIASASFPGGLFLGASVFGNGGGHNNRKLGVALVGLGSLSTNQIAPALQKTNHCRLT